MSSASAVPKGRRIFFLVWCCASCQPSRAQAAIDLWPGSAYTREQAKAAVLRGLDFIYGTAAPADNFDEYISDYLWCFYTVAQATTDDTIRTRAWRYGQRLARRWRAQVGQLPLPTNADDVSDLSMSLEASEKLGVAHRSLRRRLEALIPTFSAEDYLAFDPRRGPPPDDEITLEGREACTARGRPGEDCPTIKRTIPDYNIWYDALITVYFGDRFGVAHGASYNDLIRWRKKLLPYPSRRELGEDAYYDLVYLVTHLVYTHSDYNLRRVSPSALPHEYEYLKANMAVVMADEDGETYAEFVDTLKSFGHQPETDPQMAEAIERLMAVQNPDGSWGEVDEEDVYNRYHFTWTALCALLDYRWAGEQRVGPAPFVAAEQ